MGQKYSSAALEGALQKVSRILDEEKIQYTLAFGTLLGMIRDGHLIDNDDDVDLFIYPKHWEKAIQIMGRHFSETSFSSMQNTRACFKAFSVDGVQVDLYKLMDFAGRYGDQTGEWVVVCWTKHIFAKANVFPAARFKQYSVPRDSEYILARMYGNWRIPAEKKSYPSEIQIQLADRVCSTHAATANRIWLPIGIGLAAMILVCILCTVALKTRRN